MAVGKDEKGSPVALYLYQHVKWLDTWKEIGLLLYFSVYFLSFPISNCREIASLKDFSNREVFQRFS